MLLIKIFRPQLDKRSWSFRKFGCCGKI